jgi:Flp pilus assembly pilin Flp
MADAARRPAAHPDAARSALSRFAAAEGGATMIEYAMIAGFISIVIVAGAQQIGGQVKNMFEQMIVPFL